MRVRDLIVFFHLRSAVSSALFSCFRFLHAPVWCAFFMYLLIVSAFIFWGRAIFVSIFFAFSVRGWAGLLSASSIILVSSVLNAQPDLFALWLLYKGFLFLL